MSSVASAHDPPGSGERVLRDVFWIALGREISTVELRDQLRTFDPAHEAALIARVLSAPEFRLYYLGWLGAAGPDRDRITLERGLQGLGSNDRFVDRAYAILLGRGADPIGRAGYVSALDAGTTRSEAIRALLTSEEFERHYRGVAPEGGVVPYDRQLCELANPAKWDNPEWMAWLRELQVAPDHKLSMHRKSYEFTQLLFGLGALGRLTERTSVVSIGAGHECVLYALANHVGRVVATDLYEGAWQTVQSSEGDERVIHDPAAYAPFAYRRDHLTFLKMNALQLAFRNEVFDVAYSLSSIEHFGGVAGAAAAVDEMARVVRRGGLVVVATEYALAGPAHEEVFQPHEIHQIVNRPGLRLLQPIDEAVYARYAYKAINLYGNPHQTPHMVVRMDDTVFTTVMVFLEKT